VTNSQDPAEPKDPDQSHLFALHRLLLSEAEERALRAQYQAGGMGWGQAKKAYYEALNAQLKGPRQEYQRWMADPGALQAVLARGRDRARARASAFLDRIRSAIGIR
jgi:tryptophanyl-tRNA synthetase